MEYEIGHEIARDKLPRHINHTVEHAKMVLVRCWVCIIRKYCWLVNNKNWYESPLTESNIPDYSICRHCYPSVLKMYSNPPKEHSLGAIDFMESFNTDEPLSENCTFQAIQDWKLHNIFSVHIFIAMCDWGITAPMLESFSLARLREYVCMLITEDHSGWPFFKELYSNAPPYAKLYLLSQKDVSDLYVTPDSFDPHVILTYDDNGVGISNHPPVMKPLTAYVQNIS